MKTQRSDGQDSNSRMLIVEDPSTRHRGHNGQGIKLLRDDCDCYMEPKPDEDAHVP